MSDISHVVITLGSVQSIYSTILLLFQVIKLSDLWQTVLECSHKISRLDRDEGAGGTLTLYSVFCLYLLHSIPPLRKLSAHKVAEVIGFILSHFINELCVMMSHENSLFIEGLARSKN